MLIFFIKLFLHFLILLPPLPLLTYRINEQFMEKIFHFF